jgi:acetylornithine deacetylase
MKAGVAAMIDAARVVKDRGLESGSLIVAAVVDEEHSSIGADALVRTWTADAAIVTEPTDLAIAIAHKGFSWVEVEVFGKAAHGSRPAEGQDAILRLGRVLTALESLDRSLQARPPHPLLGTGSLHASFIEGGRELSSYPDRAALQMERRTLPHDSEMQAFDEVQQITRRLADEDPTFRATARQLFSRPAYEIASDHELPVLLMASIQTATGGRSAARTTGASFWADSAVLGHAGIPSVLFGPGGAGLHSTEEYVNLADVVICRDALANAAKQFCEGSRPGRA